MFVPTQTLQLACVAAIAAIASVDAHGYMSVPKTTFATSGDPTQFCATMDGPKTLTAPSGMSFTTDPSSNTKAFTAALKASSYKSVKALVEAKAVFGSGMSKECGVTSATGAKQPLPAQYVEWAHSSSEGFTPSHEGPCEVWCDNKLAFSNENCAVNYKSAPAKLPYNKSQCTGASMLKIYWLALHSSTWQVYINCAPLSGGSSTGGGGSATTPVVAPSSTPAKGTPSTKPATTTRAPTKTTKPATTTKAPSKTQRPSAGRPSTPTSETGADADDEDCEDDLDIADETPAPAATKATKAPSRGKTPKPTKTQKAKSRSMEYGFDELDE